jgi:sulfonate transport system ATP-binding protein
MTPSLIERHALLPQHTGSQPASRGATAPRTAAGHTPGLRIEVNALHKAFGPREVLRDVSLQIAPGEFVAIVGRSGCGKSTLLRVLAGLDAPTQGELRCDGYPLQPHTAAAQGLRLMFQDSRLLPWKTVAANVALGLQGPDVTQRVHEALAAVGLADRATDWPSALSGGQRQRVALARALVHRPRLLLLDEPLGALDALTRIDMQQLIESLWRQHQFTAVLVTHDVSEAVALADRVLLIEDGQVALDEPVPLPRPRQRGQSAFAALEDRVLRRVLQQAVNPADVRHDASPHDLRIDAWRWAI